MCAVLLQLAQKLHCSENSINAIIITIIQTATGFVPVPTHKKNYYLNVVNPEIQQCCCNIDIDHYLQGFFCSRLIKNISIRLFNYDKDDMLTMITRSPEKTLQAYVLWQDMCPPSGMVCVWVAGKTV